MKAEHIKQLTKYAILLDEIDLQSIIDDEVESLDSTDEDHDGSVSDVSELEELRDILDDVAVRLGNFGTAP